MINSLPDYIFIKDAQCRFVTTNTAHMRVLGAESLDEVVGKTDLEFFSEDLARQYLEDEHAVIKSGEPLRGRIEKAVDKEGKLQWLLTTKIPMHDSSGHVIG